jgi:ABC-type transport system involved in multi-copper enzyme maturation permease subunit
VRERRTFDNIFVNAISMLLLFFGISIVTIFLTGYVWSRERKKTFT